MIKVNSYINKAIKANQAGVDKGLMKTAIMVTTQAKLLAPVAEIAGGNLRNSIMWKGDGKDGGHTGGDKLSYNPRSGYIVGTAVEYAVYQEFGTRKMEGQPYLRPAIDIVTKGASADKAMKDAMYNTVREAMRRAGTL